MDKIIIENFIYPETSRDIIIIAEFITFEAIIFFSLRFYKQNEKFSNRVIFAGIIVLACWFFGVNPVDFGKELYKMAVDGYESNLITTADTGDGVFQVVNKE